MSDRIRKGFEVIAALREGRTVRVNPDDPAFVVNTETGTTELGPVDELPAPLELTPVELPAEQLSEPAPTLNTSAPLPSALSALSSELTPATPPTTAAPAATAEAATPGAPTTKPAPISSPLVVEPIEFSPFDTAGSDPAARTRERKSKPSLPRSRRNSTT